MSVLSHSRTSITRWSELGLASLLALGGIYFFSGYFTTVRFDRERIDIEAGKGRVRVMGLYHYRNASRLPAILNLKVPFPIDRHHPPPEWLALYESNAEGRLLADIMPMVRGNVVAFRMIFRPREAKWIRLDYAQPARTASGRYLLTTTRAWRRPLEFADFTLHLPAGCRLVASNYPVTTRISEGPAQTFAFSTTQFFPDHDWEFIWQELNRPEHSIGEEDTHETEFVHRAAWNLVSPGGSAGRLRQ